MRVAHMHGSRLKSVCSAHVVISLSSHLLLSHVSPVLAPLLFLDGHFETTPDYDLDDLTDVSVHAILPNFPEQKAQVKRTPHEDEEFGYLAKSALNTLRETECETEDTAKPLTKCLKMQVSQQHSAKANTL